MTMNWDDKVLMVDESTGKHQGVEIAMADFRNILNTHPTGPQEVEVEAEVDLTSAGAKYVASTIIIPIGAIINYVSAIITELVVAGGTTVKIGIGINNGDVDAYGAITALTKNSKCYNLFGGDPLSAEITLDVCGITTACDALGNTNISAGKVVLKAIYTIAAVPASV